VVTNQSIRGMESKHGGIRVGNGPGARYDQKKFDTPYIRDFLLDRGAAATCPRRLPPGPSFSASTPNPARRPRGVRQAAEEDILTVAPEPWPVIPA